VCSPAIHGATSTVSRHSHRLPPAIAAPSLSLAYQD
jgi:hypothetical protein